MACMARMFAGAMAGNLDHYGVPALKAALSRLASHPDVDRDRIGSDRLLPRRLDRADLRLTDHRLSAIAPFYGAAPDDARRSGGCARWWGHGRARTSPWCSLPTCGRACVGNWVAAFGWVWP